jgi:hypothetical protein
VDRGQPEISVRRQCELLGVNRSGLYYEPVGESEENEPGFHRGVLAARGMGTDGSPPG